MWWFLLWWLVMCNGSTALGVAIVNRLHGCRLPEWGIHLSHKIHYLLLVIFPCAMLIAPGWFSPGLLRGGDWSALHPSWWLVFGICVVASLIFWGSVIRRHLRRPPVQQIRIESRQLDLAQELGGPPLGHGPYQWMALLPGNEVFQLQITQREVTIPRPPPAWDGLSILHFSDAHFIGSIGRPYFEKVIEHAQGLSADLICFTGDLLDDLQLLSWLPETLGRLQAPLGRFYILGNHDWQLDMTVIRQAMDGLGWHDVSMTPQLVERDGHILHLSGSEYPWINHQPSYAGVPDNALRVLLSHTPDNMARARRDRVDVMLSGHNHGGQIRLPVIGPVYCPSRFGCYYSEGLYWETPTLLHVSRGLAGRHPLRYGCLPEITKLVLRSQ
ncbi:MAG: metallophosphoesterase [Planctomycetota bacterium]